MGASRQRADYQANADAEWNAYLAALEAGYALTQGNPDHSKMFADPANPDAPTTPIRRLWTPLTRR